MATSFDAESPTIADIEGEVLDGGKILPGFSVPAIEIFAELDRQSGQ